MRALDRKLWRDLLRMKGQALAIAILVACAVSVYVASTATHHALRRTQDVYYERYRFAQVFADLKRAPETVAESIRALPDVATVQTGVAADVALELPGSAAPATARLVGVTPGDDLNRLHLRSGRALDPLSNDEALASEAFVTATGLRMGTRLTVVVNGRRQTLRIVGVALSPEYVYAVRPGDLMPDDRHYAILWTNRAALAAAMDLTGAFNQVSLRLVPDRLVPGMSTERICAALDRILAPYGGLQAYDRERHTSHRFVSEEIRGLEAMALVIPPIFLGVAAFLLGIVFSRLVATQRQQIGTLKALGYGDRAIAAHYLSLALVITLCGTVVGSLAGSWLGGRWAAIYARFYHFPVLVYEAQASVFGRAALLALLACVIGVGAAVARVTRLPPAAAMLPEPPARYRASVLERFGDFRLLGTIEKMTLRNLSRRPLRTALSALGIGAAVGLLVVGFFFTDAVDSLVAITFDRAQREDMTVTFTTPLPRSALLELERQPGVVSGEPFRAVPVNLRHGSRSWRTTLTGLETDADVHRIVDEDGTVVTPPPAGLLLSDHLAGILKVQPGGTVIAEVLEGRRQVLTLPVSRTVNDLLGVTAYMALPAMNEIMGEGAMLSGAHLTVDSARQEALFVRLREMPRVAGVTRQEVAMASFREITEQMVLFFAGILVAFAAAIAAGIVYSSGRISLAERERELATLRVLGFTRFESWRVLAGEIAVHLGLGIPAGFLFGWGLVLLAVASFDSDLYRMPAVVARSNWATSALIVSASGAAVLAAVLRWLARLDLVSALKSPE